MQFPPSFFLIKLILSLQNKLLGIEWKKLSNGDKSGYEAQAELDKKRYQDEMKDYKPPIENAHVDNVDEKEKPEVKEGQQLQTSKSTPSPNVTSPGVSSSTKKKRKTPSVSAASVNLFAAFLKKKKTE